MYKEYQNTGTQIGDRCDICTGCGRCVGMGDGIHILTEISDNKEALPMPDGTTERLMTVDIGTTTIAMQLYGNDGTVEDRFATVNPQTVYGADVLSRIQAAEKRSDADRMRQMVRGVLRQGIERFRARIAHGETLRMVVAANTTMVYLLMGWDTAELGRAPFAVSHLEPVYTVMEGVPCYIFQGLSAFVGGDIVAGILACGMTERENITLLIDLGTNGEMVLGNREKIVACSTAAGPAFEGGVNRGVWGADMISLLARLRRDGLLDETGLLADEYFNTGVRIGDVCVTQESVRAIQLAKGAILAGIRILVRAYHITMEQIDSVVLAGGFGYYLDPHAAAFIGLIPEELAGKTVTGGNTALAGALHLGRCLLGWNDNNVGYDIRGNEKPQIKVIQLAEEDDFQEMYISSMELKP